jgi:hypothetical protein
MNRRNRNMLRLSRSVASYSPLSDQNGSRHSQLDARPMFFAGNSLFATESGVINLKDICSLSDFQRKTREHIVA